MISDGVFKVRYELSWNENCTDVRYIINIISFSPHSNFCTWSHTSRNNIYCDTHPSVVFCPVRKAIDYYGVKNEIIFADPSNNEYVMYVLWLFLYRKEIIQLRKGKGPFIDDIHDQITALKLVIKKRKDMPVFTIMHVTVMDADIVNTLCGIPGCKLHNRSGPEIDTCNYQWCIYGSFCRMDVLYDCDSHHWNLHCDGPFCAQHFRIHSIHFNVCLL